MSYAYPNSHPSSNADPDRHTNSNPHADRNANSYSDSHANSYAYAVAYWAGSNVDSGTWVDLYFF